MTIAPQSAHVHAGGAFPASIQRPPVLLLGAILALGFGLRVWGLNWGLPAVLHPDEGIYVEQARVMLAFGDPNPRYFQNPTLFTYLIAGALLVAQALGPVAGPFAPDAGGSAYLLARLASALIGTASVGLLYAIGATLFGRSVGLLAALLLTVSFLHVRDSHYGVNDVPATGLLLLSVFFTTRLLRQAALRWYLLAGLAGGLATSTKYNVGFFVVAVLVAHCLTPRPGGQRPWARSGFLALALAAAGSLAGYLVGTPYTILDFDLFRQSFLEQYRLGNTRWLGQSTDPVPLLYLLSLLQGVGALPLALALVGLALAWQRRRTETILLLAFPIAYLAFMLKTSLFFVRLALPLTPFCCLLAAYGGAELVARFRPATRFGSLGGRWRRPLLAALLTLVLAQPLVNNFLHHRLLFLTSTRVLASDWLQANVPPGSYVKAAEHSLPLPPGLRMRTPELPGLRIELLDPVARADEYRLRNLVNRDVDYVVTSSFDYDRYFMDPPRQWQRALGERYLRLQRSLEQEARLVARFEPGFGDTDLPFSVDNRYTPFWNLERHERLGPTIHIYSLAPLSVDPR